MKRTVCADVVTLDQTLVYNRFGTFNPFGMIYALRRDVVSADTPPVHVTADQCDTLLGTESGDGALAAGDVRLKDCKRPRPLVIRAAQGDVLHVRLTNLLRDHQPGLSQTFCRDSAQHPQSIGARLRDWLSWGNASAVDHGEATCDEDGYTKTAVPAERDDTDWPYTRGVNFAIQGLRSISVVEGEMPDDRCTGLAALAPGAKVDCYYLAEREGPYFFASTSAPAGGDADGGSITHGLFGAVVVEQAETRWYRSQVTKAAFDRAWPVTRSSPTGYAEQLDNVGSLDAYEAVDDAGVPVLNMLRSVGADTFELIHGDLNAVIYRPAGDGRPATAFREFSAFLHDDPKTFYTRNFEELGQFGQLAGARDGFAINYGASGMGAIVLANRKGIGPSANCVECLYEEFFLTSWANGDPALLEQFSDDPSNVHHSYLNDPVVFRNFHAGPKETHVFHLHAHQWFSGNDQNRGAFLDSQTVGPQQGFTYNIYGGGLQIYRKGEGGERGWFDSLGSGNRNRTAGDSIFHCHLYPHFAQGMWALWRVHDVLEDGSRKLPDGQELPGLSLAELPGQARSGSVEHATGRWIAPEAGKASHLGTPVPAVVPLPDMAWPLLPTYAPPVADEAGGKAAQEAKAEPVLDAFPGYPHYIAGAAGRRPPQPPMDIAREGDDHLDGGLPRHVVSGGARKPDFAVPDLPALTATDPGSALNGRVRTDREKVQAQVVAKALALGDMTMKLTSADLRLLPYDGTPLERAAMRFHHKGVGLALKGATGADAPFDAAAGGYVSAGRVAGGGIFAVNGAPPKPGAPYADPCGAPDAPDDLAVKADGTGYSYRGLPVFSATNLPADPAAAHERATAADVTDWVRFHLPGNLRPVLYVVEHGAIQQVGTPARLLEADPLLPGSAPFSPDPGVVGYRRYAASAVQLNMVTNRAGWHDPQARINVLTADSDRYKQGPGRVSPLISGSEEPFFFRALSGECIEFRHTNELPKQLELDDFQVRTPTDTIGQHIHLVKFDVTSSDGSSNGFNYEDGTFAPDEIALRICAARNGTVTDAADGAALRERDGLCIHGANGWEVAPAFKDKIWRLKISENRDLFQTTVQRWFADPILSPIRSGDEAGRADRTLRTVFSHDHFGPSSIQQHGFYNALLIEPQRSRTCEPGELALEKCTPQRNDRSLYVGGRADVGARKVIHDPDMLEALHGSRAVADLSYREYALAIADFAVLYDPRDQTTRDAMLGRLQKEGPGELKGMAMLACEMQHALANRPDRMSAVCGSDFSRDAAGAWAASGGTLPPAWLAAGRPGDRQEHRAGLSNILNGTETTALLEHMIAYRQMAAGHAPGAAAPLARPVAPPERPESISVDHHDPYLLNYRGEPLPLRVGTGHGGDCELKDISYWVGRLAVGVTETCSVDRQKPGDAGDMAMAFLSRLHGDPVTPILESYSGERVQLRLIQGAQEVQHSFTLEGYTWPRHIDQPFPSGSPLLDSVTAPETLTRLCAGLLRGGRADQYDLWLRSGVDALPDDGSRAFWRDHGKALAQCFNAEGRIAAQEVGISEHFEFQAAFRQDSNIERAALAQQVDRVPRLTDTLLHFGSVDALWNGAWGLLRVYRSKQDGPAGLPLLADVGGVEGAFDAAATDAIAALGCRYEAPVVHAAMVGIEVETVFGQTPLAYAPQLYDRNALFFALVDPRRLIVPGDPDSVTRDAITAASSWTNIPIGRIVAEIRRTYARPEPLVLPVNAGDCVHLTVLSALRHAPGQPPLGLKDDLGDAPMPPIVPLNVEPQWHDSGEANAPRVFTQQNGVNLRPSARLALSLPVPVMTDMQSVGRPFGRNQTGALAGIGSAPNPTLSMRQDAPGSSRTGQIEQLVFYAGRAAAPRGFIPANMLRSGVIVPPELNDFLTRLGDLGGNVIERLTIAEVADAQRTDMNLHGGLIMPYAGENWTLRALRPAGSSPRVVALATLLGDDPDGAKAARATALFHDWANRLTSKQVHFIPYAFGSLPLKSTGDMIGHAVHGLFGAINVAPQGSRLSGTAAVARQALTGDARAASECESPEVQADVADCGGSFVLAPRPNGAAAAPLWSALYDEVAGPQGTKHRLRQFTLFWQDGLNLRDDRTADIFHGRLPPGLAGRPAIRPPLVADCNVCDDSYDLGDVGVSYRSAPFNRLLRGVNGNPPIIESHYDFNAFDFGSRFFRRDAAAQVLEAEEGDEVVINIVHPGGRARQRSFVTIGQNYDDLFPGFGFPHSALLAPGKALSASLLEKVQRGCYLWFDGPTQLRAGGAWGLLEVKGAGDGAAPVCQ